MIESAKKNYPDIEWRIDDATKMETGEKYDIIFSNATIQWISDQVKLIADLVNMLEKTVLLQYKSHNTIPCLSVVQ